MNNKNVPLVASSSALPAASGARKGVLPVLSALFLSLVATGCYRATGLQRTSLVAEEIPETSGDRVMGLKSTAGPGDYFVGNDYVHLAVDGAVYGSAAENMVAGAASGGSIIDVSHVTLDSSYRRVAPPADLMNRLTPVLNQDPSIELVFDHYQTENMGDTSMLIMTGRVLDPSHHIAGASWDAAGVVQGVTVTHTLSLGTQDSHFNLTTTVSNNTGSTLGIRNLGDFLLQSGVGYRVVVPAQSDAAGAPLSSRWGVDIPGDGTAFNAPLASAVKAPMVGFLGTELGSATMDCHSSVGLLPLDAETFLVTSDPQKVFTETLPAFPGRVVVGSLPVASLAAGEQLTHKRRLFVSGGTSSDYYNLYATAPTVTTGLFNLMGLDVVKNLRPQDYGLLRVPLDGLAKRNSPEPYEIRTERQVGNGWQLVRVDWLEPADSLVTSTEQDSYLQEVLPVGTYRVTARSRNFESTRTLFTGSSVLTATPDVDPLVAYVQPLKIMKDRLFSSSDSIRPEADAVLDGQGTELRSLYATLGLTTEERDSTTDKPTLQPMRFTIAGTGTTPDPVLMRTSLVGTRFDSLSKGPVLLGSAPGQYQYQGGNEVFGTGFHNAGSVTLPIPAMGASANTYRIFGSRGPLSELLVQDVSTLQGQISSTQTFRVWPVGLPSGWTTFDIPGPSHATTGGYNPGEMLSSAIVEGVQVVGRTEMDRLVDAKGLYDDFMTEFTLIDDKVRPTSLSDTARTTLAYAADPFVVGARSSILPGFGEAVALFTPVPTSGRNGGARIPVRWTLADFLRQAEGQYNVVLRPRGPQGLFTTKGFSRTDLLGQGVNAWWKDGGSFAFGKTNGGFDAIELLRGNFDDASVDAWFAEFKAVRQDWFAILKQQTPDAFTKGLGLSSALYSARTPVGLSRTYLKTSPTVQTDLSGVLGALQKGAAVATTGPFLDVSIGSAGPGGLVAGPMPTATLKVTLTASAWMPVDEIRVLVNGDPVAVSLGGAPLSTLHLGDLTASATVPNQYTVTCSVPMPANGKGAFVVVEAGVPLNQSGAYAAGTPWNRIMHGIYPIAVTNPIFVDVAGGGYKPPML